MQRRSVDLPQPLGPSSEMNSPVCGAGNRSYPNAFAVITNYPLQLKSRLSGHPAHCDAFESRTFFSTWNFIHLLL